MKHFFFSFLAVVLSLAALMVSCVDEPGVLQEVDITSICCTIPKIDVEEDFATGKLDTLIATKATFSGANFLWSEGDKIGIVPSSGAQIYFEVNDGAGTSSATFQGGDWALKSTGTFYAYYPLYNDVFLSKDHVLVSYTRQTQSGNDNNLHTGNYWTLYTEGTTAVGNNLNFSFNHLTAFFKTYVTVPAGTYTKIAFTAPSEVFIKDGYFDLSAETPTIVGTTFTNELSLDLQNVTFTEETELTGYLVVAPINIAGIPITVTVYKEGEPAYEYTLTKANPMAAAKTYAFRATSLTQLASSATQANELFASGATSVTITEPLTENATIVLPNTSEDVTLTLPTTESTASLTISYDPGAASYPSTLSFTGPEGADLDIQTPNSTVTVNGVAYDQITSRTAANTCIIPVGVTVNNLKVVQGGVQVYGTVTQIDLSEQEDDAIITVSGTVSSLLGEDDEEYSPATGVSLNQAAINLNTGATETLIATVTPAGAYPKVIWTSSDETVATVSSAGVVTAVATGSATITATTISEGYTAECSVVALDNNIHFADNVVKSICVANWDTDHDGELSYPEAAAVKSIGSVFNSKTTITSFDEFKYFTGVTSLYYEFEYCNNLMTISIPESVTDIGGYALYGVHHVYFTGLTVPHFDKYSDDEDEYYACFSDYAVIHVRPEVYLSFLPAPTKDKYVKTVVVDVPNNEVWYISNNNSVLDISTYAEPTPFGANLISNTYSDGIGKMVFDAPVSQVGRNAFMVNERLTSVFLPESVTYVSSTAFGYCTMLNCVVLPLSLERIGRAAFEHCGLQYIVLPPQSRIIDDSSFPSLNPSLIPFNLSSNMSYVYQNNQWSNRLVQDGVLIEVMPNTRSFTLSDLATIGPWAAGNCKLESLTIGSQCTRIGESAFRNCTALTSIIFLGDTPPQISSYVFDNTNNCKIKVPSSAVSAYKSAWPEYASRIISL